ncbi:MAG: M43 family zinc metalloprotease [Limnohabitans sp.]|nr:M43 family zinc metalloprotease [Limnohabitans sp.]
MKKIILLFALISYVTYGQNKPLTKFCHSDVVFQELVKKDPSLSIRMKEMNERIRQFAEKNKTTNKAVQTNFTIPVIVYVVHDNQPLGVNSNISDAQVQSQLTVLNTYFSGSGMNFCLATKAGGQTLLEAAGNLPTASSTTPGIIHVNNASIANHTTTSFQEQMLVNGTSTILSKDKFFKIWVVKSINGNNSNIGGYSYFPNASTYLDGVVMDYRYFGENSSSSYNLTTNYQQGKVLVHEVGHYLGLKHTFEGGCHDNSGINGQILGDCVADTPPVYQANFGCPSSIDSCPGDGMVDDISNYMDYTYDACKNHFTNGQKDRMLFHLINYRNSLYDVDNLIFTGVCGSNNMVSSNFTGSLSNTDNNYIYNICAGSTMYFKPVISSSSYPPGSVTYAWDFGNSTTSTSENASTVYNVSSTNFYTVTLTVTFNGTSSVTTKKIFVNNCSPIINNESTWYYSLKNILKFNSGVPRTNGTIDFPGIGSSPNTDPLDNSFATINLQNDDNGNVLFFTDGKDVYNGLNPATKINNAMLIGEGAFGAESIILKSPVNTNQYYIIHKFRGLNTAFFPQDYAGIRYSIVNINNGMASMSTTINQAISPTSSQTGFVTSSAASNNAFFCGKDTQVVEKIDGGYWIISSLLKTDGKGYIGVFEFTTNGVITLKNTYLLPNISPNKNYWDISGTNPFYSVLRHDRICISPNGDKILYSASTNTPLILDFDKYNGIISETSFFNDNAITYSYNIFSPDSKLVYSHLGQMDIDTPNININPSSELLPTSCEFIYGSDNKIYYLNGNNKNELGVIHKPNNKVDNSNPNLFQNQKDILKIEFDMPFYYNRYLPNFTHAKKSTAYIVNKISAYKIGCGSYKFFPDVLANPTNPSFVWNFGDPASGTANNTSTLNTPTHLFSGSGTYTVTVTLAGSSAPIATTQVTINSLTTSPIQGTSTACFRNGTATSFNSVTMQTGQTVVWSILSGTGTILTNNQASVQITWSQLPGTIQAVITDSSGCVSTVTKTITSDSNITPTFTQVAPICAGSVLQALPTTSNNSITGSWSPALNNLTTTTYTFTPDANYCALPVTMTIIVNPTITPTFDQVAPVCLGITPVLPTTSTNGITGTWALTSSTATSLVYTFTPAAGQCTSPTLTTMTVTILPATDPSCGSGCQNAYTLSIPEANTSITYRALNTIESNTNYQVSSGKQVTMKCENSILFKPGTYLNNGSTVWAKIQPCSDTSKIVINDVDASKSNDNQNDSGEIAESNKISLFPNPSDSMITIQAGVSNQLAINIYTLDGKLIYQNAVNQSALDIDVSSFVQGMYLVEIKVDDNLMKKVKFVKK